MQAKNLLWLKRGHVYFVHERFETSVAKGENVGFFYHIVFKADIIILENIEKINKMRRMHPPVRYSSTQQLDLRQTGETDQHIIIIMVIPISRSLFTGMFLTIPLTLYLICQFCALLIQQQIKI